MPSRCANCYRDQLCRCRFCHGCGQNLDSVTAPAPAPTFDPPAPTFARCIFCNEPEPCVKHMRCAVCGVRGCCEHATSCLACKASGAPCIRCGRCAACCRGHRSEHPAWIEQPVPPPFQAGAHDARSINRFLAVEWEVAGMRGDWRDLLSGADEWGWGIVRDGSLPRSGCEILTAPASGGKIIRQIADLGAALKRAKATTSRKCGIHVHVDARDLDLHAIRRLCILWRRIEPALLEALPEYRRLNQHAMPIGSLLDPVASLRPDAPSMLVERNLAFVLYGSAQLEAYKTSKYLQCRYRTLNLHSWNYRKTVEIRALHGTLSPKIITEWAILCGGIVNAAATWKEHETQKLATGTSPREALLALCPASRQRAFLRAQWKRHSPATTRAAVARPAEAVNA